MTNHASDTIYRVYYLVMSFYLEWFFMLLQVINKQIAFYVSQSKLGIFRVSCLYPWATFESMIKTLWENFLKFLVFNLSDL